MPRRSRRRDDNSLLKTLVGLAVAAGLSSLLNRASQRGSSGRGSPLMMMLVLLAAFLGVGLLLALLGGIASLLGGAGGGALLCLAPAAVVIVVIWAIVQGQSKSQQPASATQPVQEQPASTAQTVEAPQAASASQTATAQRVSRPAAAPAQPAPRPIDAYPEKGARTPGDYRQRAASYRRRIQSLIKVRRRGPLAERLADVLPKLTSWEERVGQLADRVALFETDDLIRRDIKEVPNHIVRLRRQVALEADPDIQRQMARTLAAYEEQHRHLEALARLMRRTRLNLDDTLAAMGTIYSQVQVLNAMDIDGATAARIAGDIDAEVERLNDLLSALSEVNQGSVSSATTPASDGTEDEEETGFAGLAGRKARLERGGTG